MRTVLELTLLFTLAIVSVSYAVVRDELHDLQLKCYHYGYAKVKVDPSGSVQSIKLKMPTRAKSDSVSDLDQTQFVNLGEETALTSSP